MSDVRFAEIADVLSARALPGDRGEQGPRVAQELEGSVPPLAQWTLGAAEPDHVREANRDPLACRPGAG